MNLHKIFPHFSDRDFDPELDRIYKIHSAHSHIDALEEIFKMGVQCALDMYGDRLDRLSEKYDALSAQIADKEIEPEADVTEKAIKQTMGMGEVFRK